MLKNDSLVGQVIGNCVLKKIASFFKWGQLLTSGNQRRDGKTVLGLEFWPVGVLKDRRMRKERSIMIEKFSNQGSELHGIQQGTWRADILGAKKQYHSINI